MSETSLIASDWRNAYIIHKQLNGVTPSRVEIERKKEERGRGREKRKYARKNRNR